MTSNTSYSLRLPFSLNPECSINGLEAPQDFAAADHPARLRKQGDGYLITVSGFPNVPAATQFISNAWSALAALTAQGSACSASFQPAQITRPDDPTVAAQNLFRSLPGLTVPPQVHGIADALGPTVFREDESIVYVEGFAPTVRIGASLERTIATLREGFAAPGAQRAFADPRLRTAVDLYVASHYEASGTAQLLTSAMVLEVLAPSPPKHPVALRVLDRWEQELTAQIESLPSGSAEEEAALESLKHEILFRRAQSHRSRIRTYVTSQLGTAGVPSAANYGLKARGAYDVRSTLTHPKPEGAADVGQALTDLREILPMLIRLELGLPPKPTVP